MGDAMGLIEIVLTVCAVANPTACEERRLQFSFDGSLTQCAMTAQPYIAQWIGDHPDLVARKWICQYPGKRKQDI